MISNNDRSIISKMENAYDNGKNYINFARRIANDDKFFEEYKNIFNNPEEKPIVNTKEDALKIIDREHNLQCIIIGIGLLQLRISFESGNKELEHLLDNYNNIYKDLSAKKII